MASKIKIKLAGVEVEYEGEHEFLESELLGLIKSLMAIAPAVPASPVHPPGGPPAGLGGTGTGTVSTYAAKLKVASGPDLIIASLLQAAMVDGTASLKRKELHAKMKSATAYYKATYNSNLTASLKNLVKAGDINEVATDEYAIAPAKRTALEPQVA